MTHDSNCCGTAALLRWAVQDEVCQHKKENLNNPIPFDSFKFQVHCVEYIHHMSTDLNAYGVIKEMIVYDGDIASVD